MVLTFTSPFPVETAWSTATTTVASGFHVGAIAVVGWNVIRDTCLLGDDIIHNVENSIDELGCSIIPDNPHNRFCSAEWRGPIYGGLPWV